MVISCFQNWSSDAKGIKRSKWRLSFSLNNRSGPPNWYSLLFENFEGWVHECIPISFILKVSHKLMSWKGVYSTFDNIWCLRNVPVVNWSRGLWLWPRDIYIKRKSVKLLRVYSKGREGIIIYERPSHSSNIKLAPYRFVAESSQMDLRRLIQGL